MRAHGDEQTLAAIRSNEVPSRAGGPARSADAIVHFHIDCCCELASAPGLIVQSQTTAPLQTASPGAAGRQRARIPAAPSSIPASVRELLDASPWIRSWPRVKSIEFQLHAPRIS